MPAPYDRQGRREGSPRDGRAHAQHDGPPPYEETAEAARLGEAGHTTVVEAFDPDAMMCLAGPDGAGAALRTVAADARQEN